MTNKYQSVITEIGSEVEVFIEENMIVIFNDTVPADLRTIGVIHEKTDLVKDVETGDFLELAGERYEILFVGNKVNETIDDIGHCTIAFNGETSAELPGTICVEKKPIPELKVGAEIRFIKA